MIMEKYITKNGINYELRGEQYYPMLEISEQTNYEIEAFNDENIDNGGTEKVIIAIKQESGRIYLQLPYGGGAQARQDRGALPDRRSRARARGDRKGG